MESYPESITAPLFECIKLFDVMDMQTVEKFISLTQFVFAMTGHCEVFVMQNYEVNITNQTTHIIGQDKRLTRICPALTSTEIYHMGVLVTGDPKEDMIRLNKYIDGLPVTKLKSTIEKMLNNLKNLNMKGKRKRGNKYEIGGNYDPEAN